MNLREGTAEPSVLRKKIACLLGNLFGRKNPNLKTERVEAEPQPSPLYPGDSTTYSCRVIVRLKLCMPWIIPQMWGQRTLNLSKCYLGRVKRMSLNVRDILYPGVVLVRSFRSIQIKVHFRWFGGGVGVRQIGKTNIRWEKMPNIMNNYTMPYLKFWHFSDSLLSIVMAQQILYHLANSTVQSGACF